MSQKYSSVYPSFWTGDTGKQIRSFGKECIILALYLMTSPHKNALGLYYCPLTLISHETGLSIEEIEGALKALRRVSEGGYASFDEHSEVVFVHEMARWQIGDALKEKDNNVKWVNAVYQDIPNNPFLEEFFNKYGSKYHIKNKRFFKAPSKPLQSPLEGGPKPDTDTDTDTSALLDSIESKRAAPRSPSKKGHYEENITSVELIDKLKALGYKLQDMSENGKRINFFQWVQKCYDDEFLNKYGRPHPLALIDSGNGLINLWETTKSPWPFICKIYSTKNGNYHEKDFIAQEKEKTKAMCAAFEKLIKSEEFRHLIKDIG